MFIFNKKRVYLLTQNSLIIFMLFFLVTPTSAQQLDPEVRWQKQTQAISHTIVGDFNGDRLSDVAYQLPDETWSILFSNGSGFDALYTNPGGAQGFNDGIWTGDFNGDGLDDKLSWVNSTSSDWGGWWIHLTQRVNTNGTYLFSGETKWAAQTETNLDFMFVGDFNADGMSDVAYHSSSTNNWKVMFSDITTFLPAEVWQNDTPVDDGVLSGDFNGDGFDDKVRWKNEITSNGGWFVSITLCCNKRIGFRNEENWSLQSDNIDYYIVGDFNGDSKSDIAYHINNSSSNWKVMISNGTSFNPPTWWANGQGINNGIFIGDFNGDAIPDKLTWVNSTDGTWGGWWVATSINDEEPKVGICYSPFYWTEAQDNKWLPANLDPMKTPIVGWGNDTVSGKYSSQDETIVVKQIAAMKKVGFDFILADVSNGVPEIIPPIYKGNNVPYEGDGYALNGTKKLFEIMDTLPQNNQLPIAIYIGTEFQGRYQLCSYLGNWDGSYAKQRERQKNVIYSNQNVVGWFNNPLYFKYRGKPLFLTYLETGLDYPYPGNNPLWNFPHLTVRNMVNHAGTFAQNRSVGDGVCADHAYLFYDGMDTKRFWGWGGGALDISGNWDPRELPTDYESMSIMAGTKCWMHENDPEYIKRRNANGEEFYIRSWKQVLVAKPKFVLVADWNNWNEETAIEGCIGPNGWKDLNNNPTYDWYLQITQAYIFIFKNNVLPDDIYVKDEESDRVYLWKDFSLELQVENFKPNYKPIIELPAGLLLELISGINKPGTSEINSGKDQNIPDVFFLAANYPNPFNPLTKITYGAPEKSHVKITVYDNLGTEILVLVNMEHEPGYHEVTFDAWKLASGVYFYKMVAGNFIETKKMMLVK